MPSDKQKLNLPWIALIVNFASCHPDNQPTRFDVLLQKCKYNRSIQWVNKYFDIGSDWEYTPT